VSKEDDPNSPSYSPRPNPTWEIVITEEDWALLKKINLERTASIDLEQAIHWLNRALDHVLGQHDDNHIQLVLNDIIERINYAAHRGGCSPRPLMDQSQVQLALTLLNKMLPDLSVTQLTVDADSSLANTAVEWRVVNAIPDKSDDDLSDV
jgi:hypothetical protein